jgi:tRNA U34 2-thiouridine synthase MnmA/TrmU
VNKWRLWREYATGNHTAATLHQFENGMYVSFKEHQSAITEGQFAAWYIERISWFQVIS